MFNVVLLGERSATAEYHKTIVVGDALNKLEFEVQGCGGLRVGLLRADNDYNEVIEVLLGAEDDNNVVIR